ncbi:hypothetical protein D3C74_375220 [compost metagenome]
MNHQRFVTLYISLAPDRFINLFLGQNLAEMTQQIGEYLELLAGQQNLPAGCGLLNDIISFIYNKMLKYQRRRLGSAGPSQQDFNPRGQFIGMKRLCQIIVGKFKSLQLVVDRSTGG